MSRSSRLLNFLSLVAVAGLAVAVYGRALQFAFFNDDPTGHFAWMQGRSFLDFFLSSAEYGYYRPIVFTTLKSLVEVGGYQPQLFHGLLLVLHGANVALLWVLIWQLSRNRAYAWAVALIYITVPFNYEAVAYVASLTHPLLVFWLLLTLLFYGNGQRSGLLVWYILAYVTMVLGLFTHENGLFIPLALVGIDWLQRPFRTLTDALKRPFLPYFIAPTLFFLLWLTIPKSGEQSLPTLASFGRNLLPFLQTFVYPLLPIAKLESSQWPILLLLSLLVIGGSYLFARWAHARGLWAFALAWFILSSLPAILFLGTDYLYGSPRLNYLPSIGVAMLWGLPVLALFRQMVSQSWVRVARGLLSAGYVLLIAWPPLAFIRCEMDFYAEATEIVYAMTEAAHSAAVERLLLFVNVPFFFSSYAQHPEGCINPYTWTPVGAVVIPPYARVADFVRFNGGPNRPATAVTVHDYNPGWNTFGSEMTLAELRNQLNESAVYIFDLTTGDFFALSAAWQPDVGIQESSLAIFGGQIALLDTAVDHTDDAVTVTLNWQALSPPQSQLTAFVHLYDANGALVAQHDSPPAGAFVPMPFWEADDVIVDRHVVVIEAPLLPGSYSLAVGLYDPMSGERVTAVADGQILPENVYVLEQWNRN